VDLLEDRLEVERLHRDDAEECQRDRGRTCREAHEEQDTAHAFGNEQCRSECVPLHAQRRDEQHPERCRRDQRESDVKTQRERPEPGKALQRAEDPRLGDAALDPRRRRDREASDRERSDDWKGQEERVVGRMSRRIGEPLDVTKR
jgi:hypothetical protein